MHLICLDRHRIRRWGGFKSFLHALRNVHTVNRRHPPYSCLGDSYGPQCGDIPVCDGIYSTWHFSTKLSRIPNVLACANALQARKPWCNITVGTNVCYNEHNPSDRTNICFMAGPACSHYRCINRKLHLKPY